MGLPVVAWVSESKSDLRAGPHRKRFRQESLHSLQKSLAALNMPLIREQPEGLVPRLGSSGFRVREVIGPKEPGTEESQEEASLKLALKLVDDGGLFTKGTLSFRQSQLPPLFTTFRRLVEPIRSSKPIRVAAQAPVSLISDLFPVETPSPNQRSIMVFSGGEESGQAHLRQYLASGAIRTYKATRNGMVEANHSSKLSPWLSLGCLSPQQILRGIEDYESCHGENDSTYWLKFELLWREFFRWVAFQEGRTLFLPQGIQGLAVKWRRESSLLEAWQEGRTGFPLVDANMRELKETGWMSNRGRQIVASFFTKNLGLDWRLGAMWFEEQLLDYDVASNWGNWQYAAGVGNDAREFRLFNLDKQAKDYDPTGTYSHKWLPELSPLRGFRIYSSSVPERTKLGYPEPVVDFRLSAEENRRRYEAATRKSKPRQVAPRRGR
jgi:deoxyribodipyrimidine photo-lyase